MLNKCHAHTQTLISSGFCAPFFFLHVIMFVTFYSIKCYENSITNKDVLPFVLLRRTEKTASSVLMNCGKWFVLHTVAFEQQWAQKLLGGECVCDTSEAFVSEFCWNKSKFLRLSQMAIKSTGTSQYMYTLRSTFCQNNCHFCWWKYVKSSIFCSLQIVWHLFTSRWNFLFVFRCWDSPLSHPKWLVSFIQLKLMQLCLSDTQFN